MNKTNLNKMFKKHKLDVFVALDEQTRLWYTELLTSDGFLFIEKNKATLFVDGRYIEVAQKEAKNVDVKLYTKENLSKFLESRSWDNVGISENYVTLSQKKMLDSLVKKVNWIGIDGQELRIIKSSYEVEYIKKAAKIALRALKDTQQYIRPGVKEKEIEARLSYNMRKYGATKESFDSIVVSGPRGALPHGKPSDKKLKEGELVTIDFGAIYNGYCSDITRTFHVGEVKNEKLLEIEKVLIKAQKLGVKAVKPGVTTFDIDKVCRDYITAKGFGKYFIHSTGHGLGIDVHELPNVSSRKETARVLEPGMVITVEPGIYIEGLGGIRIEDDVLVTEKGYKVLSK